MKTAAKPRRAPLNSWREHARLVPFVVGLAVKEHLYPRLHVKPLVAELFLTDNCNLKCVSCACWRKVTREELDTNEWLDVISQLARAGIVKANFTGGEPLLRQDAPTLIAHAYDQGIKSLHLNTNAILLDERRRRGVLEAGVRSFNISVDGPTAEIHDHIRGVNGAYDKTLTHLRQLLALRDSLRLRVRMNFTVMRSNVAELPNVMKLAQELRVQLYLNLATDRTFLFRDGQVSFESRVSGDDINKVMSQLEDIVRLDRRFVPRYSELAYIPKHFNDVVQPSLPCAESQAKFMVHSTGGIGGCWGHDAVNNVRDTSIADVLNSAHYRDEHEKFFRKECVGCGSNYALNLARRPSSYIEDLLWRTGRRSLTPALSPSRATSP